MRKSTKISISVFAIAIGSIFISEYSSTADGNASGAPAGYAGDPSNGSKTCANPGCHTGAAVTPVTGWITTNIPVSGYVPDSTYTIIATATGSGHTRFGFEISPQNLAGTLMGTLVNTSTATKLVGSSKYVTHTSSTGVSGMRSWTFDWTAPASGSGDVTFYGAFNIAGGSTIQSGDSIYTSTTLVSEDVPVVTASATITASPAGAIASGTSVTFSVTPTNGGSSPTYQWQVDGSNVGTNSTTYSTATLTNGQVVTCIMTSNLPGVTGSPATSNQITMAVTTGINDPENLSSHISIYPNPISDKFCVINSLNGASRMMVNISDVNGVLVKQVQNAVAYQSIDISDLADGVYFLRIETSEGEVVKKIVKE